MIRLHMIVEGHTEEAFANRILVPFLAQLHVFVDVQLIVSKPRSNERRFKGGWNSYSVLKNHLMRWHKMDSAEEVWFTTMLDLYAVPSDFPGVAQVFPSEEPPDRVQRLEQAFKRDAEAAGIQRLVPYLQLHEFEALILADPQQLDWEFLEHEQPIRRLVAMAAAFKSPEMIDSGPTTAPSKRIIAEIPEYEARKASAGPIVVERIGLETLRDRCPHFNSWLLQLECLGNSADDGGITP